MRWNDDEDDERGFLLLDFSRQGDSSFSFKFAFALVCGEIKQRRSERLWLYRMERVQVQKARSL